MKKNKECIKVLQHIESNITSVLQKLDHLHTGDFAHTKGAAQGLLNGCKDIWIKKLKKLLNEDDT